MFYQPLKLDRRVGRVVRIKKGSNPIPRLLSAGIHTTQARARDTIRSTRRFGKRVLDKVVSFCTKPRVIRLHRIKIIFSLVIFSLALVLPGSPQAHGKGEDPSRVLQAYVDLKPLEPPQFEPQAAMPVVGITADQPNTYEWGNCTWGVASWINVPDDLGNANTWATIAASKGYVVSSVPIIGAVAQTNAGWYGHVALVTAVNGDTVTVKEMNSLGLGLVDERTTPVTDWNYIYF